MHTFEELEVWKKCRQLRIEISDLVKRFPKEEKYLLLDQLVRASRSVTANIAEGFGRYHFLENIQFCRNARGSIFEIVDHLICAKDLSYITEAEYLILKEKIDHCLKLLNGYILYLKKTLNKEKQKSNFQT